MDVPPTKGTEDDVGYKEFYGQDLNGFEADLAFLF